MFGPLRCVGVGLSDGEVMERLWSYLRRFGRMTKEMRPAHRTDVLAHALIYHGMVKKERLCMLIVHYNSIIVIMLLIYLGDLLQKRLKKAQNMKSVAEEAFLSLAASFEGIA